MPGPDPRGLEVALYDGGSFLLTAEIWPHGNPAARLARMAAVRRRIKRDGWRCQCCGDPVPLFRRADALFCRESCRKRAARQRRKGRMG